MAQTKRSKLKVAIDRGANHQVKKEIVIDNELKSLIPPLSSEEYRQLEENILKEGCRDPLIIWNNEGKHILIDGHNRYSICKTHHLDFNIRIHEFATRDLAKDWMLANQLGRRNLTQFQMSYLRGLRYENEKRQGFRKDLTSGQIDQKSKELAEEYGVGEKTIRRDAKFAVGLDKLTQGSEALRWSILNGKIQAKKNTISELVDKEEKFLRLVQEKLSEAGSLEQAINLAASTTGEENETSSVTEAGPLPEIKKRLSLLSNRAMKLEKSDPKRKEVIRELRQIFKEFLKALDNV